MVSMTALMSLFARTYAGRIDENFHDEVGEQLFRDGEYETIEKSIIDGADFFVVDKSVKGKDIIDYVAKNFLASTPVARRLFALRTVCTDIMLGCSQYLIFASGYDSFAYNEKCAKNLKIFEIDRREMLKDKIERLMGGSIEIPENLRFVESDFSDGFPKELLLKSGFDSKMKTMSGLLGLSFYLTKTELSQLIEGIGKITPSGSGIIMDYSSFRESSDLSAKKREAMADAASETMKSSYTQNEISSLFYENGFLIYEYLEPADIEEQFFSSYNYFHSKNKFKADKNVCFILAIKR